MAKTSSSGSFSFADLDKQLSKIDGFETGSILTENTFSEVSEWISTGNYLLNAQISGSLFGGVANNRSFGIMGDPGCMQKNEKVRIYRVRNEKLSYERKFREESK